MTTREEQDEYAAAERTSWHRTRWVLLVAAVTITAVWFGLAFVGGELL